MIEKSINKNDIAWETLFYKYKIIDEIQKNSFVEISAKQINEFREARLMTKFDHKVNLPNIFKENNLSILPVTRGKYIISSFEAYHIFEKKNTEVERITPPNYIKSIDFEDITSESVAINVAYLSGILSDFVNEEFLYPTVNGRMSSKNFSYKIINNNTKTYQNIDVNNSQIEIDGGFEGLNSLNLIEAKNAISNDFIIRQLYYPYRLWNEKLLQTNKQVKTIFLIYSNGIFHLYEYAFQNTNIYNSLLLVKQKNYTMENQGITLVEIINIFECIKIEEEPLGIPFPQADNFIRIINICELLHLNKYLTREEITTNYDFDIRQTNYYTDACRYLGLIKKSKNELNEVNYCLTKKGLELFSLNIKKRNLAFVRIILEKKAFYESFKKYIFDLNGPNRNEIVKIMENSGLYNIRSKSTFNRRASTINSWINWIIELTR